MALILFGIFGVALKASADPKFRGRVDLDYSSTEFQNNQESQFNQNLELSVTDELFVKNILTLSYLLERLTADRQVDDIVRQRWRANLAGRYFTLSGEITPRYQLRGTTETTAQHLTGRRLNVVVSPPKLPVTSVTLDRNERVGGGTGTSAVNVVNVDRFIRSTYVVDYFNFRGLIRERETENRLEINGTRQVRNYNWGVGARIPISSKVNLTTDYDFLFTQDRGAPQLLGESVVNNVSTRATVRPIRWVTGFTSFLGNYIRKDNASRQRSSLSEIVAGVGVTPADFLRLSVSRDYRLIREEQNEQISDFVRAEAVAQGRIRERMEGRATVTRTFVLRSRDGSFPSQGYLFHLNTHLFPGVSLLSDFNVIQSENPDLPSGRFQVRRVLDLRTIPTNRIMLDFNAQTFSFGDEFPWFTTQVLTLGMDAQYQPAQRFTVIATFEREEDRRVLRQDDFLFTGTLNYLFRGGSTFSFIYNRRSTEFQSEGLNDLSTASFSSAQEGFLFQFNLKMRDRANLRLSFDTRTIRGDEKLVTVGANFVKWF
jgi:hypothetical protein